MSSNFLAQARQHLAVGTSLFALLVNLGAPVPVGAQEPTQSILTTSPIKHVIVIIGENRTFDHIFATYEPKSGQTVDNLLSKGIVNEDGTPGPNYSLALQYSAVDTNGDGYQISPMSKSLYSKLPAPLTGGPSNVCKNNGICTLAEARASENGLASGYYQYLLTGGTGQASRLMRTSIPAGSTRGRLPGRPEPVMWLMAFTIFLTL